MKKLIRHTLRTLGMLATLVPLGIVFAVAGSAWLTILAGIGMGYTIYFWAEGFGK